MNEIVFFVLILSFITFLSWLNPRTIHRDTADPQSATPVRQFPTPSTSTSGSSTLKISSSLLNSLQKDRYASRAEIQELQGELNEFNQLLENERRLTVELEEQKNRLSNYWSEQVSEHSRKRLDERYEIERLKQQQEKNLDLIRNYKGKDFREEQLYSRLKMYTEYHKNMLDGKIPPFYLRCRPMNGYGNVFQEAVSCFLLALFTNRAIINDVEGLNRYLKLQEYLDSPTIDHFRHQVLEGIKSEETIESKEIMCYDVLNQTAHLTILTIGFTYDYWGYCLFANPRYYQFARSLPNNFYGILFSYLFKLKPELEKEKEEFKKEKFGKFNVGIQIRYPTEVVKAGSGVDHKGMPVPPISLFMSTAHRISLEQRKADYDSVRWFVATQNPEVEKVIAQHFPGKVVTLPGKMVTTFEDDYEGKKSALLVWWILGECDEVITTEISSYGPTATARTGLVPITCAHEKFCFRKTSSQPCQQTPYWTLQPLKCIAGQKFEYFTPENSCGFFLIQVYDDPLGRHHSDSFPRSPYS